MGIRYLSAGESHGPELTAIIEGFPANVEIDLGEINFQLERRQKGHGRGGRMKIENDQVEVVSGVRFSHTTGAPVGLKVKNNDWKNWQDRMAHFGEPTESIEAVTKPRPGHADLSGGIKYQQRDLRNILERASARETTIRVAVGAFARQILQHFGIELFSHVLQIGAVKNLRPLRPYETVNTLGWKDTVEKSPVRCHNPKMAAAMMEEIDRHKEQGDTVGGVVEVIVTGLPVGLGSYVHWEHKLDSRLAAAVMSVQAIKGVEFGIGFDSASKPGSEVHDAIFYEDHRGFYRKSNMAGGVEGGMSNGNPLVMRAAMKPIPTLYKPLESVDINTKETFAASIERSDACAVPAAAVVLENVVAWELTRAFLDKFSGNSLEEIQLQWDSYKALADQY